MSAKGLFSQSLYLSHMFHMENTQLDSAVRFSEALHAFKQDTFKYAYTLDTTDSPKESQKTSMLENIRLVAQEGVQSSRHTNQLETLLASQKPHLQMLNEDILNSNEMLTLSVLDLSLTIGQTYQISNNLCDVAMKYLKLCESLDNTEHASFFLKIYQLFYESKSNMSVTTILCDVRIPLSIKEWRENNIFWSDFRNNYCTFDDIERTKTDVEGQSHDNNRLLGLNTLKKMSAIYSSDRRYLQNIHSHLQFLYTIIPDANNDASIQTVTDLLKTPLHRYFGYQIFDLQTEPHKLETIASSLQVNLIYSILVNTCPNISCCNERSYTSIEDYGCVILNWNRIKSDTKNVAIKGPNQCVSEILTELLQVLRNVSSQSRLDNSYLRNISNHTDVQTVLDKTSSFATLDLSELSVGDETLTFFLNVWNVMFLHACLSIWCNDPSFDSLRHMVSSVSIGYVIGDLGLVTLASLRSKLLGNLMNELKFFTRVEELNELAWQDLDLVQNPKVVFAMANEFYGTPEIRVYETQTLNKSLNDAIRDYISHYSTKSPYDDSTPELTKQKITLPDLVRQYRNALSQNASTGVGANGNSMDGLETLEDTDVEYIASSYAYEVILEYVEHNAPVVRITNATEMSLWQTRRLRPNLLQYLESRCWLLSYLLQRMHNENTTILENNYDNTRRTACLENLLNSLWVQKLKPLFNGNQTLAAIHDSVPVHELWRYFEHEGDNRNWESSLEMLNALADNVTRYNTELLRFKDLILSHVLSNLAVLSTTKVLQYLYQIKDIHILAQTILHNINKWPMNMCEHALFHALQHEHSHRLPTHCKHRMNSILCRITIFHKMIPYCVSKSNSTWYDVVYCTEKIDPFQIIKSLINADQFELCLEWLECQAFSLEIPPSMIQDFLIGLLKNEQGDFDQALKFLQALPLSQSMKVCKGVLKKLESTSALKFVANYLLERCRATEKSKYRKTLVGVDILKILESKERALYIHLIKEPLLMLEQLLMNCKFESIQKVLFTLHEDLQHPDMNIGNFDKVIRLYAKKSLDFRVSLQRDGIENKSKNVPQSNVEAENNEFVMPVNVPTKEEWVPNDKARECSCCEAVIFSMFNRRHHCRRCGRVICAICSQHRMQVAGYPASVPVRVCDDCKRQTVLQMRAVQDAPSTPSSEAFDYWRLTKDERHNRTIREEFSFEYAPNISLCLAILNLHSDHKMYTSFLLDCCHEMKQLLQPVGGGRINPEIDHAVIIKMIRSLLVAAKVKCAKLGFNTGLAHCDRFLSQVDLIATLVQSDCLALIPKDDLNEHTLRKLRDLLTEKEQWTLALDVSTKGGLDTQGVWAAWGKACLKVGYFEQAREKLHHCLDKIVQEDFDGWVMLTYSKDPAEEGRREVVEMTSTPKRSKASDEDEKVSESGHSKRNEFSKCRPLKDPPLLTEILQILDNLSMHRSRAQYPSQSVSDTAQEILQTLNSLKAVSQNQFNAKHLTSQTIYYQESLYYLLMYGSYSSILQFFLKHKEFDKCLMYIHENDLERDLFLNKVYLYCLKNGDTADLHDVMKTKDPTLFMWRKYLMHVCHFMERKQYWHILYQLQLFMRDCIRASMTCIRFYINEANTYSDLHNKVHLLQDAQRHLESELQIESLNKRKKSTCSIYNSQGVLAMEMEPSEIDRHINTICRQTEIAKFLANCEREERATVEFLNLFPDVDTDNSHTRQLPTLFGDQQEKIHLAVLAVLCGRDIEEGFGIAFRIMQDYNLPQQKVYSLAGHVLALKNNIAEIEQLIKCCRSSGAPNAYVISDHVLTHCVKLLLNRSYSTQDLVLKNHIDTLVRLIIDIELRINAYIESKQLKAAYLLAVKHSRAQDIRKILKESDRLGQSAIKAICLKWLQQEPKE
ncbi:zinc finger FYVE domain-containing protein 26 homolog isoform X2 [Odontomachus brunneus]|uniref:zinc finger FYVE domain-containing protein 26 homolog isoform X2 n=1 Tax=Odontomachus brunneus TaxID=486640 RepID=UPI0013F1F917|nr:zinc finger FYVE domain-containing protein 26 homolog isoform X2 [Odontomachus brunneus]